MIINAYPEAFDSTCLQFIRPHQPHRLAVSPHTLGSAIMVCLMGVIVFATYHRLALMVANSSHHTFLDYLAEAASFCFALLIAVLCVIRLKPCRQAKGLTPVIAALAGTFLLTVVNLTPMTELAPSVKSVAVLLLAMGNVLSVYCLAYLGRSFSLLPQARKLVTDGPYRLVRHPLYITEVIAALGMILLHFNALSAMTGLVIVATQMRRALYEERVLSDAFPEYAAYADRVPRFIPGLI